MSLTSLKFEYYVDLKYKQKDGKIVDIDQSNVKSIKIHKSYDTYNMPIVTVNLTTDKRLVNEMILNMKETSFIMKMYKFQVDTKDDANIVKELYFEEEFTYITQQDIAKGNKVEYMEEKLDGDTKEDKYMDIHLGFISKSLMESNLKPNNSTIYNSNMQDIITSLLNINVPLLIEPFDKTENIDQLIIPPKESIAKTLDYLNTVRVFYNTGYRFFMDFENIFLVSKAGKATPRSNDKYETVMIDIKELSEQGSLAEGLEADDEAKRYIITIPDTGVNYIKDNITDKELDGFTAIIDPSKSIQQEYLNKSKGFGGIMGTYKNIMNLIDGVKSAAGQVRQTIKNIHQVTDEIKGTFYEIKNQAMAIKDVVRSTADVAKDFLKSIPQEIQGEFEILGEAGEILTGPKNLKKTILAVVESATGMSELEHGKILGSEDAFKVFKDVYKKQIYHLEDFQSLVGAVPPGCFGPNVSAMIKKSKEIPEKQEEVKDKHQETMVEFNKSYGKYKELNTALVNDIKSIPDHLQVVIKKDLQGKASEIRHIDFTELKKGYEDLVKNLGFVKAKSVQAAKDTKTMETAIKTNEVSGSNIINITGKASDIPRDFSKQLLEGANTYVKSLNASIDSYKKNFANTKTKWKATQSELKTSLSTLWQNGASTLEQIGDLSKVGKNGESMVDVALDIFGVAEDLGKRKLIRIPNDNMGLISSIKHALELKATNITLSKDRLDNGIFNINMRYTINNNKEGHTEATGDFLLMSKTETYTNGGERMIPTTMLSFARLPKKK